MNVDRRFECTNFRSNDGVQCTSQVLVRKPASTDAPCVVQTAATVVPLQLPIQPPLQLHAFPWATTKSNRAGRGPVGQGLERSRSTLSRDLAAPSLAGNSPTVMVLPSYLKPPMHSSCMVSKGPSYAGADKCHLLQLVVVGTGCSWSVGASIKLGCYPLFCLSLPC